MAILRVPFLLSLSLSFFFTITKSSAQQPTEAPSSSSSSSSSSLLNECDNITLGEITFLLVSASDPFDEVSFFGFEDLPGNVNLYLTDNAWNGNTFEQTEGVMQLTTPPEGIPAGTPIGLGPSDLVYSYGTNWTSAQGIFALSTEGEQVFLYCLNGQQQPRPIAAISYNGP
jgi:hypothetical protein